MKCSPNNQALLYWTALGATLIESCCYGVTYLFYIRTLRISKRERYMSRFTLYVFFSLVPVLTTIVCLVLHVKKRIPENSNLEARKHTLRSSFLKD